MNIIIIGCGKVGLTLAEQLCQEDHAVTLVDRDQNRLDDAVNSLDVQAVLGNGTSHRTLMDAGVETAELMIAVTDHDELNMLACLMARKIGRCQTIARVRNPGYYEDIAYIKDELGLTMVINPELAAAQNIFQLLQIPSALDVDTFEKSRINMLRFQIKEGSPLDGKNMMAINSMLGGNMLVCIRERGGEIAIPSGGTTLKVGDKVSVVIPHMAIGQILQKLKIRQKSIRSVLIAGGGNTAVYLSLMLLRSGIQVKIMENDLARCQELAERIPRAKIIHGDSTDRQLLQEEGLRDAEAFICLTGLDEENIMLALYAEKISRAKVVTKISRIDFEEVIDSLPLGSVIYPKNITAENIVRYVRAMENASGNNVETLYKLLDGQVEAMEFVVRPGSTNITGVPIQELGLKKNLLVCSINRHGRNIIPTGHDTIEVGDTVVVVTTHKGIRDLSDIVRY